LGPIPNPQSPIPNPQSPISFKYKIKNLNQIYYLLNNYYKLNKFKLNVNLIK
jgi:hypothetical protein